MTRNSSWLYTTMSPFITLMRIRRGCGGEEERPALLPKTKGSGVMVSDFVEEHEGYLRLSDDQYERDKANQPLHCSVNWTRERFLMQIKIACDIAQFKYPPHSHTVVFILDQITLHAAFWSRMEGHVAFGTLSGLDSLSRCCFQTVQPRA